MLKSLFRPIDLTEGKIWKVIALFTLPIFLSLLLQQIYVITDAIICGQFLSANEVAGVNNTSNINFMVLQFAFGCTAGFSVVSANKIGQRDIKGARQSLLVQVILSTIISIILTVIGVLAIRPLLAVIGVKEEYNLEIFNSACTYILIIFIGLFGQIFYNLACCFLRSLGDSVTPLFFLLFSSVLNIGLDILFIASFKWGVMGAALATIIAQALAALGCFIYIFIKLKDYRFKKEDFKFNKEFVFKHLKLGLPLAFQNSILSFGLIVMQGTTIKFDALPDGSLSNESQLGYGAACKLNGFIMTPFIALGNAMLSYSGQNLGAKNHERIRNGVKAAHIIMLIMVLVFVGIGLLSTINGAYLHLFLSPDKINDRVIKFSNLYLYTNLPFYPFLGSLFILRNTLQGVERPAWPLYAGIMELIARLGVCWFLPEFVNGGPLNSMASDWAYISTAAADLASWILADIPLLLGYILFRKKVVENSLLDLSK